MTMQKFVTAACSALAISFAVNVARLNHPTQPDPLRVKVEQEVKDFWDDPRHPYAEKVAPIMAALIDQAHAEGRPIPSLEQVYEMACSMDPEVKAALEASRQAVKASSTK
jgi:hypothetical protein